MQELQAAGVPLESEREPPHAYWSVPDGWFPGGALLSGDELRDVVRHLFRAPRTATRNRLLRKLLKAAPSASESGLPPVLSTALDAEGARWIDFIEDSITQRFALLLEYLPARGAVTDRVVSAQRLVLGERPRFIAWCHRDLKLKWWRADRVVSASRAADRTYIARDDAEVEVFVGTSIDHFRDEAPHAHVFIVDDSEAAWVRSNLPQCSARFEELPDGLRIVVQGSGVGALARFVVGLGGAAVCESDALREAVRQLAESALRRCQGHEAGDSPPIDRVDGAQPRW